MLKRFGKGRAFGNCNGGKQQRFLLWFVRWAAIREYQHQPAVQTHTLHGKHCANWICSPQDSFQMAANNWKGGICHYESLWASPCEGFCFVCWGDARLLKPPETQFSPYYRASVLLFYTSFQRVCLKNELVPIGQQRWCWWVRLNRVLLRSCFMVGWWPCVSAAFTLT